MPQVEIFSPTAVIAGTTPRAPGVGGGSELPRALLIQEARWYPLDGTRGERRGTLAVTGEDLLLVVAPPPDTSAMGTRHPLTIEIGPYRVTAMVSTPAGFHPGRTILRPTGPFVAFHDAAIVLTTRPGSAVARRSYVLVNRYAVEHVTSPLSLGFFFPGAGFEEAAVEVLQSVG